jgi:hypothetical protein
MQKILRMTFLWILAAALLAACQPEMIPQPLEPASTVTSAPAAAAQPSPTTLPSATPLPGAAVPTPTQIVKQLTREPLPTAQENPSVNESLLPPPYDASVQALVDQAKADLAKRLSVSADQIEVQDVSTVTWPDGSLGCPKPGMAYTQVLVDGMRIHLQNGGQVYDYHSGSGRAPFLCEK